MVAGLEITSTEHDGSCVLTAAGELDMAHSRTLEVALIRHTDHDTPLILDLSGVQFMDSSGLYVVLRTCHEFRKLDRRLILVPSTIVMRVIELAGVQHTLALCPSVDEALAVLDPMTRRDTSLATEP